MLIPLAVFWDLWLATGVYLVLVFFEVCPLWLSGAANLD